MHAISDIAILAGRILIAVLFTAGVVQKFTAPEAVEGLLATHGWPIFLVWPAFALNALGVFSLLTGVWITPMALILAIYCLITSLFHFIPEDPWQMSIFIKNWAIAGGLLVLFGHLVQDPRH